MSKIASMTGFAAVSGTESGAGWAWEARSVNARGLDIKFRLPAGLDRLEAELRGAFGGIARGTITVALRLKPGDSSAPVIDTALLARLAEAADRLAATRPGTKPPRIELLMALPGVVRREANDTEGLPNAAALAEIRTGFATLLAQLVHARNAEGARLGQLVAQLLNRLAELVSQAGPAAAQQIEAQRTRLHTTVETLMAGWPAPPAERMLQELATLASRSDVTEEIDRLGSHLVAARQLLMAGGPAGRQLDFLVQEFMREANTLCSKSASVDLTAIGLQMKTVIEQIREQVQNIE